MSSAARTWDPAASWAMRSGERSLLLACVACMGIGFLLALASGPAEGQPADGQVLLPFALYAASLAGLHLGLVLAGFRGDAVLVVTTAFLAGLGLLIQTRMGAFDGAALDAPVRLIFPAGILIMLGTALTLSGGRYRVLGRATWLWGALALALVAALLATGERFRGAVFGLGLTTPTEALKVLAVLFLAGYVDGRARALGAWHPRLPLPPFKPLWPLAAYWTVLTGLLLVQRDLGMTAILAAALLAVLVTGTGRLGYGVYGALAAAGLGYLLLAFFEHGQRRIDAWHNPFEDPTGDGWQILQGLSGMFAGGLWGEGFGQGSPEYTPIAESDFVYTVIGEELGWIGCALTVFFYLVLLLRGLRLARCAPSPFGRILGAGLTAAISTQVLLNIGGVTKLIPLTGTTLPLLSHGGTSLLTTFAALGLLLAISDGASGQSRKAQAGAGGRSTAKRATPRQGGARGLKAARQSLPTHPRPDPVAPS